MIWDKLGILRALFPFAHGREAAADYGDRWQTASTREPRLAGDLIRLGGVLALQPTEGAEVAPIDPMRLAYEAGKRDLALQLLALMKLTNTELSNLMEDNNV